MLFVFAGVTLASCKGELTGGPGLDGLVVDGGALDGRVSDGGVPDGHISDGHISDGPVADGLVADGPAFDGPKADVPIADARRPDARVPDARRPDARRPDARVPDSAVPDSAVPDAAVPDAHIPGVNSAPRPIRQRVQRTAINQSISFTPFVDPDGDAVTLSLNQAPANGTLTISGATCTYAPKAGARGRERFKLVASDGKASSAAVQFVVSIGDTYYVDATNGEDANDGKDPSRAWQTLGKVNAATLLPEDWVLFRRGEAWYGQLWPKSGSDAGYVKYGAYGTGNKPRLLGCRSRSLPEDWTLVQGQTAIWTTGTFTEDVGNIIFNDGESVATRRWARSELQAEGDYWYDSSSGMVELRSTDHPAAGGRRVDLALRITIIDESGAHHVMYENLDLRYSAREGISGPNTHHIIVKGCEFHFIGGGAFGMDGEHHVRLGNGVEFYDSAHDNVVEGCIFSEMFDGPVTNQGDADGSSVYNITYRNNLMWNNEECIEIWLQGSGTSMSNIVVENNTCINTGQGWSNRQRWGEYGWDIGLIETTATVSKVYVRNNIFFNAKLYAIAVSPAFNDLANVVFDNNLLLPASTGVVSHWSGTSCKDLACHQAASGQDQHSIAVDPVFQAGSKVRYYLSQIAAGASRDSPALNKGYGEASQSCLDLLGEVICLSDLTTRVDGAPDEGKADLGAHFEP